MKHTLYTLIFLTMSLPAFAQKWDGSSSTNWNIAANWDNNTVPTSGTTVTIDVSAPNQPKLTGSVSIKELKLSAGTLDLNGFTLTTSDKVEFKGGTIKNGFVVANKEYAKMENTTFTGPLTLTHNGPGQSKGKGNNTFNGAVTIINNTVSDFQMAETDADIFNGNMTFVQQNVTGNFSPAFKGANIFKGNISTLGSVKPVMFGNGGGSVIINGTVVQNVYGPAAQGPVFKVLDMNTTKGLILNVPVSIGNTLTLNSGIIYSTLTNLLIINDNATSTGAKNSSHVSGPVRKIGNDIFTFPTGKGSLYGPISISAPSNATHHFTAEYFNIPTPHTMALLDILTLHHISKEEYWALNRTGGTSTVVVTLSFNSAERSGTVNNLTHLRVARWNTLLNLSSSHGNGGTTGNVLAGTVQTAGAIGSFGDFAMASSSTQNPMLMIVAPLNMDYKAPTVLGGNTWVFPNVRNGVDAVISVVGSKNATVDEIDNASIYNNSWQPFIKYTNTTYNNSDSSYVEFRVDFLKNGLPEVQKSIAMTIVDEDGEGYVGGYRELLKVSQPSVAKGIANSLITVAQDANWTTLIGTSMLFPTIDTTAYAAMSQVNITNTSTYTMRVGVLGKISGGAVRQASFAFNNFSSMNVVLPVKLLNIEAKYVGNDAKVSWMTSEEKNMKSFDVYRSVDGVNFTMVGAVRASGNNQMISSYDLTDLHIAGSSENVYYRLKMIDQNEHFTWSPVVLLRKTASVTATVGKVYPNPTKGELNLIFDHADTDFSVEVVDMFGKVLKSFSQSDLANASVLSLDVTDFSSGVYFIKVTSLDGAASLTRFIKN